MTEFRGDPMIPVCQRIHLGSLIQIKPGGPHNHPLAGADLAACYSRLHGDRGQCQDVADPKEIFL